MTLTASGRRACARGMLLVFAALSIGCGSSPAPALHVLSASPEVAPAVRFAASVGVGPVTVPEYLDRLQLVSRNASDSLVISDTDRWAEPLREGTTRVLVETLSGLLGTARIVGFPWPRSAAPQLRVPVELVRFDADSHGIVRLEARWSVIRSDGEVRLASHTTRVEVPSRGDVESRVRAQGEAVARLGRDISAGLRDIEPR